jgi:hypothetical protein
MPQDITYLGPDTGADKGPEADVDYNKVIAFPEPPDVAPFKDDQALNDTLYYSRSAYQYRTRAGILIVIPADFHTDLLSAPQVSWSALGMPPDGYYRSAAYVHDYLYGTNGLNGVFTRQQCDLILVEILGQLGCPWLKQKAVYLAVRLFGGSHWKGK